MNNEFYELCLPIEIQYGKWDGKWTVCTLHSVIGEPHGYLHNDNKLYSYWFSTAAVSIGIFETRLDALMEMKSYYYSHRYDFPYRKELSNEVNVKIALTRQLQDIESQTIVFK